MTPEEQKVKIEEIKTKLLYSPEMNFYLEDGLKEAMTFAEQQAYKKVREMMPEESAVAMTNSDYIQGHKDGHNQYREQLLSPLNSLINE